LKLNTLIGAGLLLHAAALPVFAQELQPPTAFVTNCQACHIVDEALVGPSLVEIAELYPEDNLSDFIKWCIEPQKKRDQMPVMPSMVHVPESELIEVYHYIKKVTVGVKKVKRPATDPYATQPESIRRPRVERTFVPHAGPASMIVSLPTDRKHNLIWDTVQCRLRYISEGETSRWPYLRSNGNSLAEVGTVCYVEETPVFESDRVQFKGYHISDQGYPSFVYTVDESTVTEEISVEDGKIIRTIEGSPSLPDYIHPKSQGEKLQTTTKVSVNRLSIVHSATR